ncbi:hypothetical protein CBL_10118 [Carabus blaptoides fortunei]
MPVKSRTNRTLLVEKHDVRLLRLDYLRKIRVYRNADRPIVYLDETYIHSSHTVPKTWSDDPTKGLMSPGSKGQRLIIVHAGYKEEFISGAGLIFKSQTKTGDYHDEMNSTNFIKYLRQKIIPNLPTPSVLVMENASYHNVQERCPTSSSRKAEMREWLQSKQINKILADSGFEVLRLPPYYPDLNPIEMMWASLKQDVEEIKAEWSNRCRHVCKIEDEYAAKEPTIDEEMDRIIINLGEDSSDTESSIETASSDSEESEGLSGINKLSRPFISVNYGPVARPRSGVPKDGFRFGRCSFVFCQLQVKYRVHVLAEPPSHRDCPAVRRERGGRAGAEYPGGSHRRAIYQPRTTTTAAVSGAIHQPRTIVTAASGAIHRALASVASATSAHGGGGVGGVVAIRCNIPSEYRGHRGGAGGADAVTRSTSPNSSVTDSEATEVDATFTVETRGQSPAVKSSTAMIMYTGTSNSLGDANGVKRALLL